MKVLLLRTQPAAQRTARALARLGHEAVLAPLLEIEAVAEGRLPPPEAGARYGAVIGASANAFAHLHAESRARLAGLPALVVGTRTAQAARAAGLRLARPAFRDAQALGEGLAQALAATPLTGTLLYLAGRERRPEIEAALRREKGAFVLAEIYAACIVPALPGAAAAALRQGQLGAVLHYSERSARAYVALAGAAGLLAQALAVRQLCLSQTIARPLLATGAASVGIAASPDERHLLALLAGTPGS